MRMNGAVTLYKNTKRSLSDVAPYFLCALLIAQPFLDIISYWSNEWEFTAVTTLARFAMFAGVMVYGFVISDRKRNYVIMTAVMVAYWIAHIYACIKSNGGYVSPISDANNFLRTIHLPYFTLVFIDIFKKSDKTPEYVQRAFVANMVITLHALVLSYMTGTQIYTYVVAKVGLMSWASVHNSQSAIMAFIVPLILLFAYNKKNKLFFYISALVCFANLFFVGTKVDYFAIFIIALGMMALLILAGEKKLFYYAVLGVLAIACALCYRTSTAAFVTGNHTVEMNTKQEYVQQSMEQIQDEGEKPLPNHISWEIYDELNPLEKKEIVDLYRLHLGPMVDEFGFDRVFEKYNFSLVVSELTAGRPMKQHYAEMKFEDSNTLTRLFGYEYITLVKNYEVKINETETEKKDFIYDMENDFPGVYYYSGYVGFALYMLFLAYFVGLILVGVIKKFKKVVTLESGLIGITLALMVGTSQFSGNVLRRPNASIYMSVILAYIYYLTVIKEDIRIIDIFKRKKKDN